MADFSLTTLFVVPVGQTSIPSTGTSTQDLTAGQVGFFGADYDAEDTDLSAEPYWYVAQGRENTYLQGSKRSDKIKEGKNVFEWYKVAGNPVAANQITTITDFDVKPNEEISITIRAHSSYIDTLYFNGLTRSITIPAECLTCGGDPCTAVTPETVIDAALVEFAKGAPGDAPDNITFDTFFRFEKLGTTVLVIEGKPLTAYGEPCDVAAFPHEYDRMWFDVFVYKGADTTADFLASDACESVATVTTTQESNYPSGTSAEIAQLEKNLYSYHAGYLKHLHRMAGYNQNFESYVNSGTNYSTFYIRFNDYDRPSQNWSDYVNMDSMVIIAVESGSAAETAIEAVLESDLGAISADNTLATTTTTTTATPTTTTTTTT